MTGPPVYRAPMRSRDDRVPDGVAVERALSLGVCGVGGVLESSPASLEEALVSVDSAYGERMARRLERFAAVPDGALVWTRDSDHLWWLGMLDGPWSYDAASAAREVDLVHVRPCRWLTAPVAPSGVPPAVRAAFGRGGRNWQRIRDAGASPASAALWRRPENA
ncbi:GAF domain-containing protein [Microbacterium sp. MYb66]|uniref:GAF domain-containing protein n=1 Tax=Microbacterium sp. MYb66 TaxID=1848692 RepID=UPI000D0049EE|nr:GAF domain-containing protein [Microbacterium sp. MYb66]PRA78475.1 GAF domain-containing protein [Microbacterium sp. MYb66]